MKKIARIHERYVSVCGVGELPNFAGQGVTHIVSIWDGYEAENPEPRLRIETIFPGASARFGFFNDALDSRRSSFSPDRSDIQDILNFTEGLKTGDYLLVHCAVGVSRSTAIAFATLCQHAGPGLERDCFRALKGIRPSASPNPLIVEIADELLKRCGSMAEAIKARTGP